MKTFQKLKKVENQAKLFPDPKKDWIKKAKLFVIKVKAFTH